MTHTAPSNEAVQSAIHQAAQAWQQASADDFANLFAASGVLIVPGSRWIGPTAIRQAFNDFFATKTDVLIEVRQMVIQGQHAMVEWGWSDRSRETGARSHAEDAIAIDFDPAGKILRWREYIDAA
ncbi:MAG: SgcJ/EcaC family oxidoreductase [Leptolyngbya sp. SIO4C1]|nr:SgcJ/EcaC family oxidoreductase [Leptolyngbya sp. SIO4C1]